MTFKIYISKSKFLPLFQVCIKGEKDQLMFHSDRFVRQKWKNDFFPLFPILTNVYFLHMLFYEQEKRSVFLVKGIEHGLRTFQITALEL